MSGQTVHPPLRRISHLWIRPTTDPKYLGSCTKQSLNVRRQHWIHEDEGVRARPAVTAVQGGLGHTLHLRTQHGARASSCFRACSRSWDQCPEGSREDCVGSSWYFIPESTGFVEDILVGLSGRPGCIQQ